ncbi:uncharacterized protein LOC126336558 [Schistocerca gregaria]|uniref:uncharacterized protein LOC126336558 n=1 Tax=Schistocerca gregaria TaxID=7010 RepID=UPI00211E5501|nr:uncharacterized protein LOC126336558 [Schistocerca gregaria]
MNLMSAAHLIFILQYSIKNARCMQCYQCRSDRDEGCYQAPVDDNYLLSCPDNDTGGSPFCRKIHQILYFTKNSDEAYVRECGYLRHPEKEACFLSRFPHTGYQLTCECVNDACNRAEARHLPTFAAAATITVVIAIAI